MTWAEFSAARQLLAEEGAGASLRHAQRAEDAIVAATQDALRRQSATR